MVEQVENAPTPNGGANAIKDAPQKRVLSEIEFPYADLEAAGELASVLQQRAGGESEDAELAAWLNQSVNGGTYRSRRSAARMFGLIDLSQGRVTLTPLGRDLVDDVKSRAARAEAFLKPELHLAMYEKLRGTVLPPAAAIERMMGGLGVSPKQVERARQVFQKSATHASFIDPTNGRFIKPASTPGSINDPPSEKPEDKGGNGGSGGGDDALQLDPLLMALLHKIPPKGSEWGAAKRVRWFRTFAMNVSQIYDTDDEVIELKIEPIPGT
ncbi:hypothetical protein ACQW02_09750 [Humitalea sp. 24SJ18S-53]|uniref:hypothetical protein n=1 Tax=Humitalea sp. 24SJ18S-53 TaxID=3422307 RepID=UPI003D670471